MAIQVRRGNESDFDASKMLPGEWAVSLDTKYVRMCFAPGVVLRMATYEGFENDKAQFQAILAECRSIQSAVQRIQAEVNSKASLVVEYSNNAKTSADKAHSEAERAKVYADNAEAVTGVQIATKERAGLIKGGDNHIAEDGTLMLITTTTSTTQPNSYAGRENILEIGGGESEQETTAGNQLFDGALEQGSYNGTGDKISSTTRIRCANNIAINPNDTYTLFCNGAKAGAIFEMNENGKFTVLSSFASLPLTFTTSSNARHIVFALRIDDTNSITPSMVNDVMLNKGTTALPYEKYTGGQPAPNPSYPMEIKKTVVSGVRTYWKNLLKNIAESKTASGVTFTVNNDGSITINGTATADINFNVVNTITKESNLYFNVFKLGGSYSGTINQVAYTSDYKGGTSADLGTAQVLHDKYDYSRFRISVLSGAVCNNLVLGLMVSKKEYINTYEPYTESSYTFSQPIELYGMNGVRDVITAKQTKRKFAKRIFDGSENWVKSNSTQSFYLDGITDALPYGLGLCEQFTIVQKQDTSTLNIAYFQTSKRLIMNCDFASVAEWKAHLAEKPMEVVYQLAEETTEALPIADQIGLNSLATYDGITYVEFDSEIQPTFKAEYGTSKVGGYTLESLLTARNNELKQNMVNERLSALEASVVNNI